MSDKKLARIHRSVGFGLDTTESELAADVFDDVSITSGKNLSRSRGKSKDESDSDGEGSKNSSGNGSKGSKESEQSKKSKSSQQSKTSSRSGYSAGSAVVTKTSDDDSFHSAQDSIDSNSDANEQRGSDDLQDIKKAFETNNTFNLARLFKAKSWNARSWRKRDLSPARPENIDLELSWEEPFHDPNSSDKSIGWNRKSGVPSLKSTDHTRRHRIVKLTSMVCCGLLFLAVASWLSVFLVHAQLETNLFNVMLHDSGKNDAALEAVLISTINQNIGIGKTLLRFDVDQRILVTMHLDGTNGVPIPSAQGTWQIVAGSGCTLESGVAVLQNNPFNEEMFPQGPNTWSMQSPKGVSAQNRYFAKSMDELVGNALVLFDDNEHILACGLLRKIPHPPVKHVLWAYPGADGFAKGKVRLDFYQDDSFHFGFNFSTSAAGNVLPGAVSLPSPMTIENYDSCPQVADPLFYYAPPLANPWTLANGAYHSEQEQNHGFYMYNGYSYEEHIGRTVVMRDAGTGVVIACGELQREIDMIRMAVGY
mmetsp:Transcript_27128/g.41035  ORF Transcript_27128/g.41035 Transcript_27128/m.41035 type:complete len:536 (-) Transcript_27128:73-1680(-)|eukprot:CAMPEP_0178913660 /NCGR_PEP_ID=MMETSP0786-20121207/10971_1 /TAXON_ID=186022 /ORGANISM="Thalassionema frauenfeldii, Strain CCMP 1798" /LENGTH=535 /DNA_ID=CAMNT_0020586437 /DNA_START=257 /DNA_END=1864 /DNA_ORIENTATION=+